MSSDGYNPMRYDCDRSGCFNKKKRPKIEMFASCLPRKLAFSDVDAVVDVKGRFLYLEWKGRHVDPPEGQKILFENSTHFCPRNMVFIVEGDAETMDVWSLIVVRGGITGRKKKIDFRGLQDKIRDWAIWADGLNYELSELEKE